MMRFLPKLKKKKSRWIRVDNSDYERRSIKPEEYYQQSVTIHLNRNSELFCRITTLAEKTGKPVEEVFSWAVLLGIEKHIEERIGILEELHTKD